MVQPSAKSMALDYVIQGPVKPSPKCYQQERFHLFSWQPAPIFLMVKFLPHVQIPFLLKQLVSLASCPTAVYLEGEGTFSFSITIFYLLEDYD